MIPDAERRLAFSCGYNQCLADLAEADVILLTLRVTQLEHELEVAAMAALEQQETIAQLEAVITSAGNVNPNN